jgi:predicted N-acetyltransferase YhbS
MALEQRGFAGGVDFVRVSEFLTSLYLPDNRDGNWLQPMWEYAYTHPWFDQASISRIGLWEESGRIVGLATYESRLGEAFIHAGNEYPYLKPEMLSYAERHLTGLDEQREPFLKVYVNDFDHTFQAVVSARGYSRHLASDRPMSQYRISDPFPRIRVPEGFRVQSLSDENDLRKVHRVLYRGFNHPGEPPEEGIEGRRRMQSGPSFRKDLAIVAVAPSADYVSYCGMWYDAANRFGYVEPVATDPDYRRRGLGTAVVVEGIRRCGALGATVAYVGSDLPFYQSIGFRKVHTQECWFKHFPSPEVGAWPE